MYIIATALIKCKQVEGLLKMFVNSYYICSTIFFFLSSALTECMLQLRVFLLCILLKFFLKYTIVTAL